ncbi:protein kinase domain-containing protein [Pyxidicoccus caerfyrddinensis]|uniref:protein kinase domain-containing protein n=1 Tax=Pyxidicoccus caerfyrddinensis TaxID=2709663 RepID=UPI0013DB4547|nr:tetratricopeptide repeat protein [Pyxidicoccus caerfyrddinensis]
MNCPDEGSLSLYVAGLLAAAEHEALRAHLRDCSECRAALGALEAPDDEPPEARGALVPGDRVGRFVVLYPVGEGGMGRVYAAYDPELDRNVALKVLHARQLRRLDLPQAKARLEREARAMARLSHPHVASIHDVGERDGQLFLVMELLEGGTLRQWLRERPRSRQEVLTAFAQAAEGLAAAHAVGIVHRDFKPDNVVLTRDGQVRVTDFGLAHAVASPQVGAPVPKGTLGEPLTVSGALLGTPAYSAPEQLRGERGDARADQFSFCVALYEALNGQHPFQATTPEELLARVEAGTIRSETTRLPGWLRAAVRRGLSASPVSRFGSMAELGRLLSRDPHRWKKRAAALAVGVLLSVMAVHQSVATWRQRNELCRDSARHLAGIWDARSREAVHRAFLATGSPAAPYSFQAVATALDRFAQDWVAQHEESCAATRLRGEQSDQMLELRMACLERRRKDLEALSAALQRAEATTVEEGFQLGASLGGLSRCADTRALREAVPLPDDPAVQAEVQAVRAELSRSQAEALAGRRLEAMKLAVASRERALRTRYRPLEAEALLAMGRLQHREGAFEEARRSLTQAALSAEAGRSFAVLVQSLSALAWVQSTRLAAPEEAFHHLQRAEAVLEQLQDPDLAADVKATRAELLEAQGRFDEAEPLLAELVDRAGARADTWEWAQMRMRQGVLLMKQGRPMDARRIHEEATARYEKLRGPSDWEVATALLNLGATLYEQGELTRAEELFQRALRTYQSFFGKPALDTALTLTNLALLYSEWGRSREALQAAEEAVAMARQLLTPDHPYLGMLEGNRLTILGEMGDRTLELEYSRRQMAQRERDYGADHAEVGLDLHSIGVLLRELGRPAEAREAHRRARLLLAPRLEAGKSSGEELLATADAEWFLGETVDARRHAEAALKTLERAYGPRALPRVDALHLMGRMHLARGELAQSLLPLQEALKVLTEQSITSARTPLVRATLAQALHETGAAREACAQARIARAELVPWARAHPREQAELAAFLSRCQ